MPRSRRSIGRNRWWATKLLICGLPVITAMAVLGLVSTWGMQPLSYIAHGRMMTPGFETQGLVVAAYTALAFAIGATAGLLSRSTVAAMAVTIGLYLALLVVVGGTRADYLDPVESYGTVVEGAAPGSQGSRSLVPADAWRVGTRYFDDKGSEVDFNPSSCKDSDGTIENCLQRQGIAGLSARYHPDNQFWNLQLIESGVFLAISGALLGVGGWALRKRSF